MPVSEYPGRGNQNPQARDAQIYKLGLTGWPLGHSLSPRLHAAGLAATGLAGDYRLFPFPPTAEGREQLQGLLNQVRAGELHGLNVTIPHKQAVIPWLDELSPAAAGIGAVNTIVLRDGRLAGENTDAPGFLADLAHLWPRPGPGAKAAIPSNGRVLVLGAGGSARAVVYALLQAGWRLTIAARRREQAQALAVLNPGNAPLDMIGLPFDAGALPEEIDLIVNTTPLGMTPDVASSPWPSGLAFPPRAALYDLVYNPRLTTLAQAAGAAGLPVRTGLGMLIEQAVLSFEIWTGCRPPARVLWEAVL